jgi:hypothetical protein
MKKILVVIVASALLLAACTAVPMEEMDQPQEMGQTDQDNREKSLGQGSGKNSIQETEKFEGVLTDEEAEGLIFMREEEKLARDVYYRLADIWGMNIFSNIASSEEMHMDAVLNQLDREGLEDPVGEAPIGTFTNPELQELYDDLLERGGQSLSEALLVGGAIEEIDIIDLQEFISETDNPAITAVYQNLLKGSINHLRAFSRTYLNQTGMEYVPQFLSQAEFDDLMNSESVQGSGGGEGINASPQGRGKASGRSN